MALDGTDMGVPGGEEAVLGRDNALEDSAQWGVVCWPRAPGRVRPRIAC